MIKTAVARRYAQALFELLDQPAFAPTRAALSGLGEAIGSSAALRHVLASPAFGVGEKIAVLTALGSRLGCPVIGQTFLGQLVKKNRVGYLLEIADAFGKLVDAAKGMQHVTVASATTLPQPEQERVKKRLREMLKRDVDVTFQSDPQYLAGLQITIGSTVVDSTIRGRLDAMRTVLTRE